MEAVILEGGLTTMAARSLRDLRPLLCPPLVSTISGQQRVKRVLLLVGGGGVWGGGGVNAAWLLPIATG